MPIFHIGGSGWGLMGLYHGAKGVIAREFDPTKVLDFFEQSGITKLFMVPAAMQFVVRQPRARQVDFSRLKYMLYGASPIPAALLRECIEVFKCGFVQMYGMTETTGTIVALPPEDHVEGLDRMRSAGKALPGVELAILDADGKRLPAGEVGEIATRSGSNMVGLLEPAGSDRENARQRRLAAHRRRRLHGQGRLPLYPRPHQGHDHLRRREHLSRRSRKRDLRPSRCRRSRRGRRARRQMGRSGQGDRGDEARQAGNVIRHHQLYARAHRRIQDAQDGRLHRGAAAQCARARSCGVICAIPIGRARIGR